jgi:hypothetical protein
MVALDRGRREMVEPKHLSLVDPRHHLPYTLGQVVLRGENDVG